MTRTEDRLTDALSAAARAVPEETLRPLIAPPARRRQSVWLAPVAAALGIVLVVGLALAVGTRLSGSRSTGRPAGSQGPVPRYYVVEGVRGGQPVVRSTATGQITDTVPVSKTASVFDVLASTRGGVFFVAAAAPGTEGQRLYRFRLTSAGRVTGFTPVPGGPIGRHYWAADALAVSPDGSRVAVSVAYTWAGPSTTCGGPGQQTCPLGTPQPDYIEVIDLKTGARSVWRGGNGAAYSVASLSWTANGRELVYLGQTCADQKQNSEMCTKYGRTAVVRALNPASGGGRLGSGPVLLRQTGQFPYIAQALISPDGRTITALVLTGQMTSHGESDVLPPNLAVIQLSRATGQLRVLYRRDLGHPVGTAFAPDVLQLSQDAAGQHWMLNSSVCSGHCPGGFNGWLRDGHLVPLSPVNGQEVDQAW